MTNEDLNKMRDDLAEQYAPYMRTVDRGNFKAGWGARDNIAKEELASQKKHYEKMFDEQAAFIAGSCAGATARHFQDEINELRLCVKDFRSALEWYEKYCSDDASIAIRVLAKHKGVL